MSCHIKDMKTDLPQTIHLKDYRPYPYAVEHVEMNFDIHEGYTIVNNSMTLRALTHHPENIVLNGEHLDLMAIKMDGECVEPIEKNNKTLIIGKPNTKECLLQITTRIHPEDNTSLDGLYKSGGTYCTQCEAEGFRK